jgi:hypothetical protein
MQVLCSGFYEPDWSYAQLSAMAEARWHAKVVSRLFEWIWRELPNFKIDGS